MKNKIKYDIRITPIGEESIPPYIITLETDDLDWSMQQYARNRSPFTFEVDKTWE
tara:strand:+ start:2550 stop:2714 length:165 start_codon:yes stop_codon:yes gene_type:complete